MSGEFESEKEIPKWRPLSLRQRRVFGVLIEKAKTTPSSYPMTLNAIVVASNQKSNRNPQLSLNAHEVDTVLDELRALEAVVEVHGDGRVAKYKHTAYQWMGVDKVEIAVMAELLLRGEQTVGELRGRASRMENIDSVASLQPILQRLIERKLVVSLTPPGRGQMVTHGLYSDTELEQVKKLVGAGGGIDSTAASTQVSESQTSEKPNVAGQGLVAEKSALPSGTVSEGTQAVLDSVRGEIAELKKQIDDIFERLKRIES